MEDKSQFAGFWKRFAAYLLDGLILGVGIFVLGLVLFGVLLFGMKMDAKDEAMNLVILAFYAVGMLSHLLYFAIFESSAKQATPGKMILSIVVTNSSGGRITFWRALARNIARFLSGLFFGLGYIICGFTDRRQAVHDLICSTLVVKNDAPLRTKGPEAMQIMHTPQAIAPQASAPPAGTVQTGTPQASTPQATAPQEGTPQEGE